MAAAKRQSQRALGALNAVTTRGGAGDKAPPTAVAVASPTAEWGPSSDNPIFQLESRAAAPPAAAAAAAKLAPPVAPVPPTPPPFMSQPKAFASATVPPTTHTTTTATTTTARAKNFFDSDPDV